MIIRNKYLYLTTTKLRKFRKEALAMSDGVIITLIICGALVIISYINKNGSNKGDKDKK